ncbi:Fibroblast growth factor receptor-like 1 [Armadillidium vulgare]|nr:Fibroblast growth factor receptor-like 1 [Armadillidium vulgare]
MSDSGRLFNVVHQSLPLNQMTPEDSGNYTCLATNIHGGVTANWTLNVVGSVPNEGPETFPLEMDNVTSFSGEEAALSCRGSWDSGVTPKVMWLRQVSEENMENLPKNQTFPYMGNYYQVLQPTELLLMDNGLFMTKLVFQNVQRDDAGVYFCTVSNRYGINFRQASLSNQMPVEG